MRFRLLTLVLILASTSRAVAQIANNSEATYNDLQHSALSAEVAGNFKVAIVDFTKALATANGAAELSETYKFRADAERKIGDINGAMQDEANADYVAMGWDANPPTGEDTPGCTSTAVAAKDLKPYRAYPGCTAGSAGIIKLIGVRARYVDGRPFFNSPSHGKSDKTAYIENNSSLELPAGRHSILFILPHPQVCSLAFLSRCPIDMGVLYEGVEVEAGKTYTATGSGLTSNDWLLVINTTGIMMPISPSPTWELPTWQDGPQVPSHHVEIDRQESSSDAYLARYETALKSGRADAALSTLRVALAIFPVDPNRRHIEELANSLRDKLQKVQIDTIRSGLRAAASGTIERAIEPPANLSCQKPVGIEVPADTESPGSESTNDDSSSAQDLESVLLRAANYVEAYQTKLGTLLGREVYVQKAEWTGLLAKTQRQETESDFALRQIGESWAGVREVNCVNGKAVKNKSQDFDSIFAADTAANLERTLNRIANESAAFNIGDFHRTTNQPTFGLEVLYHENTDHFEFQKSGETEVGDSHVWIVNFREIRGPTLVKDGNGRDQFSHGTLWLEPLSGRVVKTEVSVPSRGFPVFRARTIVTYAENARLRLLVPATMDEHYDSDSGHRLDCHAEYFDFHRFEVEMHFDFNAPPPKSPPPQEKQ